MSINFGTLQGLTIPQGVVTQITDAAGRVLWMLSGGKVILEVKKITATTYAGETAYENEQFILLDIYPKTNGTVKVTYGGLTKTITDTSGAAEPNAKNVFFGTLNGVSDSVVTPTSGQLTIEGDYYAFGGGAYQSGSKTTQKSYYNGITDVCEWGGVQHIATYAFYENPNITQMALPDTVTSIGNYAFYACPSLASVSTGRGVSIGNYAFYNCPSITSLPDATTSIGDYAFYKCSSLNVTEIPEGVTSIGDNAFSMPLDKQYGDCVTAMKNGTITLPSTITNIGKCAFGYAESDSATGGYLYYCYLYEVKILATTPPTLGAYPFGMGGGASKYHVDKITVPKGCGEVYKAAEGWSLYANYIVEAT